jgi:hypothetical protein
LVRAGEQLQLKQLPMRNESTLAERIALLERIAARGR